MSRIATTVAILPLPASAWNIPGHMLSAAIAYQVLQRENRLTIEKVKAVLEKHLRYAHQWQATLKLFPTEHAFMQLGRLTIFASERPNPNFQPHH